MIALLPSFLPSFPGSNSKICFLSYHVLVKIISDGNEMKKTRVSYQGMEWNGTYSIG